ncbi:hypothetical protein EYE40_05335 [Glaciihabitans arcticus]|uniref:Uncharacterized protein n=1 Tax=Glaciihabitans arcticus TaxID=2668039 RepID=A0A4Q9GX80_9MICO|nr:hypothetical protein [Glaciihabitans arcticus]TBN56870.1 hypothetical protein EYE40_05335 [Glaciihabitans arcticus]
MTYQNRSRRLLQDFTWVGLLGGAVIALISGIVLNRDGSAGELAAAAIWLLIGQALFSFGVLSLIGLTVAKSVAYDIRNAHLPEFEDKPKVAVAKPDADPIA